MTGLRSSEVAHLPNSKKKTGGLTMGSAMGSAASGGSSVAVGDAALMGPSFPSTPDDIGSTEVYTNKALDFRSPDLLLLFFLSLLISWQADCAGAGVWGAGQPFPCCP